MTEYEIMIEKIRERMEKRSLFLKAVNDGEFITVEIGNLFGDTYVVGADRVEAAKWLEEHTSVSRNGTIEDTFRKIQECATRFNVIIDTIY